MKTRSAAAWVLLSIALIAGYWYTGTLEEEKQRAVFEAKRLFDFEGEDVVWLSITTRENDAIEAKRLGENWTSPTHTCIPITRYGRISQKTYRF